MYVKPCIHIEQENIYRRADRVWVTAHSVSDTSVFLRVVGRLRRCSRRFPTALTTKQNDTTKRNDSAALMVEEISLNR